MARHGLGVDDLTDDELRASAVARVGDQPGALEVSMRALTAPQTRTTNDFASAAR